MLETLINGFYAGLYPSLIPGKTRSGLYFQLWDVPVKPSITCYIQGPGIIFFSSWLVIILVFVSSSVILMLFNCPLVTDGTNRSPAKGL